MVSDRWRFLHRGNHCAGEPVNAGWIFIALGVGSAAVFQHVDSVVFGAMVAILGVWVLTIKELKR
jgi:hypothetical protein